MHPDLHVLELSFPILLSFFWVLDERDLESRHIWALEQLRLHGPSVEPVVLEVDIDQVRLFVWSREHRLALHIGKSRSILSYLVGIKLSSTVDEDSHLPHHWGLSPPL